MGSPLFGLRRFQGNTSIQPLPGGVGPAPVLPGQGAPADTVAELLSQLEGFQPPPPPTLTPRQRIAGTIGDALLAMATVKAGGVPPPLGPFQARQQQIQDEFRQGQQQAELANRDLRNRIRIGAFEDRQQAKSEEAKERIRVEAAEAKSRVDAENQLRDKIIEKILDSNVDTSGINILETPTAELKKILDGHDPGAGFAAVVESLPPDMTLDRVRINKDGTISFEVERVGAGKELPAGLISTLIQSGVDPAPFIQDPTLAAAATTAATANAKATMEKEADSFLADIQRSAERNTEKPDGSIDQVNEFTASSAADLQRMARAKATPDGVADYYQEEANAVAEMVVAGSLSEAEATDYLTRLRQMISIRFPGVRLEVRQTAPEPQPQAPAAAPPAPSGPPSGFGKAAASIGKGLGKAVEGILGAPETLNLVKPGGGAGGGGGGGAN